MMLEAISFTWWAWAILAMILAVFEIILPAFVFLGMTIGAACVSLFMLLGGAGIIEGSVAATLVIFAVASLIATLILRWMFELPKGQVKTFDRDIND
jgi:membrane protein implicated in regulation of membrane protease activity